MTLVRVTRAEPIAKCPACKRDVTADLAVELDTGGWHLDDTDDKVKVTMPGEVKGARFVHDCMPKHTRGLLEGMFDTPRAAEPEAKREPRC